MTGCVLSSAAAIAAMSQGLFAQSGGTFWLPPPESSTAQAVDDVFYFVFYIAAFFFALIVGLMVAFVVLYRRRPGVEPGPAIKQNLPLEIAWTAIPLALVIVIFYWGFTEYLEIRESPPRAYEIRVIGKKWSWLFKYPNGYVDEELHVPVDEPVRLIMTSEDVIHSLYIPEFRLKMDLVPGRYTSTWFRATRPDRYDLYCAEYCGTGHSAMLSSVVAHPPGEFEPWLKKAGNWMAAVPPAEAGRELYRRRGCAQCHSTDGSAGTGPSFKGIFGQTHRFTDGTSAVVDENYIRQSVLEPEAKIREGFTPQMPTYQGILNDDEIAALTEFIKSLK
jgi:cytochrome c oxidase subunit 2